MPRQRLGVDSYSLRLQGWSAFELCDYAARQKLDNVHLSERHNLATLDPGYLAELRSHAESRGLTLEIGMRSIDRFAESFEPVLGTGEQQLSDMIVAASCVGSPIVRCFMGAQADRRGSTPFGQHYAECLRVLRAVVPVARDHGVKIGVENHGGVDMLARELRRLIEDAGPDHVGACLDTGNPTWAGEDPLLATELLVDLVVSTHVRDSAVWEIDEGAAAQWVVLGEGNVEVERCVSLLAERAPDCPIDLEVITGSNPMPVPYLRPESDYWRMYPDMPASDFSRFVALARDGRVRGLGPRDQTVIQRGQSQVPPALVEQQRRDFESSVRYAVDVLGLGVRAHS